MVPHLVLLLRGRRLVERHAPALTPPRAARMRVRDLVRVLLRRVMVLLRCPRRALRRAGRGREVQRGRHGRALVLQLGGVRRGSGVPLGPRVRPPAPSELDVGHEAEAARACVGAEGIGPDKGWVRRGHGAQLVECRDVGVGDEGERVAVTRREAGEWAGAKLCRWGTER